MASIREFARNPELLANHPLMQYREIQRLFKNKRFGTLRQYLRFLPIIMEKTGLNPHTFVQKAFDNATRVTVIEDLIHATDSSLAKADALNCSKIARALLKRNGFQNLPTETAEYKPDYHPGYTKKEILAIRSYTTHPIHRLYQQIAAVSGLRVNNILDLQYKHIKDDFETAQTYVALRFEKAFYDRTKAPGYTFIGPSETALIKQLIGQGVVKTHSNSYLFASPGDPSHPISIAAITKVIQIARRKANISPSKQPSHGFRKYFDNALNELKDTDGANEDKIRMLEGHYSSTRPAAYNDRSWESLRPLYAQLYPVLDLDAPEYKQLEAQLLKPDPQTMTILTQTLAALNDLRAKYDRLEHEYRQLTTKPQPPKELPS